MVLSQTKRGIKLLQNDYLWNPQFWKLITKKVPPFKKYPQNCAMISYSNPQTTTTHRVLKHTKWESPHQTSQTKYVTTTRDYLRDIWREPQLCGITDPAMLAMLLTSYNQTPFSPHTHNETTTNIGSDIQHYIRIMSERVCWLNHIDKPSETKRWDW